MVYEKLLCRIAIGPLWVESALNDATEQTVEVVTSALVQCLLIANLENL